MGKSRNLFTGFLLTWCFIANCCYSGQIQAQITFTEAVIRLQHTGFAEINTWLYPEFDRASNILKIPKAAGDCRKQVAGINVLNVFKGQLPAGTIVAPPQ